MEGREGGGGDHYSRFMPRQTRVRSEIIPILGSGNKSARIRMVTYVVYNNIYILILPLF